MSALIETTTDQIRNPQAFQARISVPEIRTHARGSDLAWLEGDRFLARYDTVVSGYGMDIYLSSAVSTNPIFLEIFSELDRSQMDHGEQMFRDAAQAFHVGLGEFGVLRNMNTGLPSIFRIDEPHPFEDRSTTVFFTRKRAPLETSEFIKVAVCDSGDAQGVTEELSRFGYGIHMKDLSDLEETPDLSGILEAMHNETGTLLQPSLESLQGSFEKGEAVVLMDGPTPVGFVRFSELLNEESRSALDLPDDFPLIYETGSAIILPEYRGRHLYPGLRTRLLSLVAERIKNRELLVLGTTKSPKVIESLDDANELGLGFEIIDPHDNPMVASFTCVCEGDFGSGFQNGSACFNRATKTEIALVAKHDWKAVQEAGNRSDGKIPCTVYVSDVELMNKMEDRLTILFRSQAELVNELRGIGHYE